jgi:glutaredoxin 3
MPEIVIYCSAFCPYCTWAKKLLDAKNASYTEIRIDQVEGAREEMLERSNGRMTVPQIFIGDTHVGGFDDLQALDRAGKLDPMLAG